VYLWILPRTISDHCPLVLNCGNRDWSPSWTTRNSKKLVEEVWRNQSVNGWMRVVLNTNPKKLNEEIRKWSKVECGDLDTKMEKLVEEIANLDVQAKLVAWGVEWRGGGVEKNN